MNTLENQTRELNFHKQLTQDILEDEKYKEESRRTNHRMDAMESSTRYQEDWNGSNPDETREELNLELENRIKNLIWTVSGDYNLQCKVNPDYFLKAKEAALYEGIKQGAFAKYFDRDRLTLYLMKKTYLHAVEAPLLLIAQLCIDKAIASRISHERLGISAIRKKAYEQVLEEEFESLAKSPLGRVKAAILSEGIKGHYETSKQNRKYMDLIEKLSDTGDVDEIIRSIDRIYNELVDPYFEKQRGTLEQVLAVTNEELTEFDWQDYLDENAAEAYANQLAERLTSMESFEEEEKKPEEASSRRKIVVANEEALKKVYSYVELNYGKTYLSSVDEKRLNFSICKGIHSDCGLYFTEGILKNPVKRNYQYEYARKQREKNKYAYYDNHRMVKRNIEKLTDTFKKTLTLKMEEDEVLSDHGRLKPSLLWKTRYTNDAKVFVKEQKNQDQELVVDILIDASGSQRKRQSQVAMQAYIISMALSNVGIHHRVMSFCTFWDHTILQRFRDYEDDRSENENIFEYMTSSNNRDGLAIKAAAVDLLQREEEHKIMIILSDGRPYDVIVNRPNARNPKPYQGSYAIRDTGLEVRSLRNTGVSVLGVFAGERIDLEAEKKIFGKDFAYIQNINNFSDIVGRYLKKQMEI